MGGYRGHRTSTGNRTPAATGAHPGHGYASPKAAQYPGWSLNGPNQWGQSGSIAVDGSGQNLVVDPSTLKTAAGNLGKTADALKGLLPTLHSSGEQAAAAIAPTGGRPWPQASALHTQLTNAHQLVSSFVNDLATAHDQTANALTSASSTFDAAETHNAKQVGQIGKQLGDLQDTWNPSNASVSLVQQGGLTASAPQALAVDRMIDHMPDEQGAQSYSWPVIKTVTNGNPLPVSVTDGTSDVTPADIHEMMANAPNAINDLGAASSSYQELSTQLGNAANDLATMGNKLAATFSGKAAVKTVNQVQQLYQTAQTLQTNSYQMVQTLNYHQTTLSTFSSNMPALPPANAPANSPAVVNANSTAQQYLVNLNTGISNAYTLLPPTVNQNLPPKPASSGNKGSSGGGTNGGGPGGSLLPPGSTGTGTGSLGTGPGGSVTPGGPQLPGGNTPAPTTLASVPPGSTTMPTAPTPVTPTGTTSPGTTSSVVPPVTMPSIPSGNSGTTGDGSDSGLGENDPGGIDVPGLGSLGTGAAGSGTAGNGTGDGVGTTGDEVGVGDGITSPGDGAVGFPGMGGMGGMGGFGGGSSGEGRLRQAWESEEDGLWDSPGDGTFAAADLPGLSGDGMIGAGAAFGDAPAAAFGGADSFAAGGAMAGGTTAADSGMFPFMGGAGAGNGRDGNDRQRQAWMSEDADVWDPGANGVPPVIG